MSTAVLDKSYGFLTLLISYKKKTNISESDIELILSPLSAISKVDATLNRHYLYFLTFLNFRKDDQLYQKLKGYENRDMLFIYIKLLNECVKNTFTTQLDIINWLRLHSFRLGKEELIYLFQILELSWLHNVDIKSMTFFQFYEGFGKYLITAIDVFLKSATVEEFNKRMKELDSYSAHLALHLVCAYHGSSWIEEYVTLLDSITIQKYSKHLKLLFET